MNQHKEFRARTLDQAIADACRFFVIDRDGLEIEIISGGSAGFFGLGARQAVIRARRRRLVSDLAESGMENPSADESLPEEIPAREAVEDDAVEASLADAEEDASESGMDGPEEQDGEDISSAPLPDADAGRLEDEARKVLSALLRPLCGEARLTVNAAENPVSVHIEAADAEMIVGRDGEVLAALQYLANRILARSWPGCPRIRLDAGDYRRDQEARLTEMALALSGKAKKSGRVQSTRPLSAFHRRVVHLTLQDDKGVQTRSKGEGAMKRVLIMPVRRSRGKGRQEHNEQ